MSCLAASARAEPSSEHLHGPRLHQSTLPKNSEPEVPLLQLCRVHQSSFQFQLARRTPTLTVRDAAQFLEPKPNWGGVGRVVPLADRTLCPALLLQQQCRRGGVRHRRARINARPGDYGARRLAQPCRTAPPPVPRSPVKLSTGPGKGDAH